MMEDQRTSKQCSQNETIPKQFDFCTFQQCNDTLCRHGLGHRNHLIINEEVRKPEIFDHSPPPFAVSYTWGIKPHKKHYLGHSPEGKAYHIDLGPEWNPELFFERLVHYSRGLPAGNPTGVSANDPSGLRLGWLDQICNKKKDRNLTMRKRLLDWTGHNEDDNPEEEDLDEYDSNKDDSDEDDPGEDDSDEGDPEALNQMPHIFQRCEVIVLFPGTHCRCIYRNTAPADVDTSEAGASPVCLNYINLITWWNRLWPRQEFVYANRITVDWINGGGLQECLPTGPFRDTELRKMAYLCGIQYAELFWLQARTRGRPCQNQACKALLKRQLRFKLEIMLISKARNIQPLEVADLDDISRIVENWFSKTKIQAESVEKELSQKEHCPCEIALEDFRTYQQAHFKTMELTLEEKQANAVGSVRLNDFLLGKPIQTEQWGCQSDISFERFWFRLGKLSRSKREVTKPKDLVRAVWPECPGFMYQSPKAKKCYKSFLRPLKGGLEHLINSRLALITTAPYGLFREKGSCTSWEWVPKLYMKPRASGESGKAKNSGKVVDQFPGITSYAYGSMASPFVPVPIQHRHGRQFLALQYHNHHLGWRSLLADSELLEEKFPMMDTAPGGAAPDEAAPDGSVLEGTTPDGPTPDEERLKMIKEFVSSVTQNWPETIRNRCRGPRRVILELVLKKMNTFVNDRALPKVAVDVTADMTAWGFYTTRFMLRHRANFILLLTLMTGKKQMAEEGSTLNRVLNIMDFFTQGPVKKWALSTLEKEKKKQHSELYLNQAMQALRDQLFHEKSIWPDSDLGTLDHTKVDLSKETRVHHLDTIYYMVAEALGFRPADLGLDYNQSFKEGGLAYKAAKPLLVTSERAGHLMLGLMSRYCYEQNAEERWTRRSGEFMTVAFRNGDMATDSNPEAETCLYEVEMQPDQSDSGPKTWRIVGVWVPVTSARVMDMVSGWFGPDAEPHGLLL